MTSNSEGYFFTISLTGVWSIGIDNKLFDFPSTDIIFKPYPLEIGQKIHIEGGPRGGDWEVIGVSERKVKLRCPVSLREFEWDRFCYFAKEQQDREWPRMD